MDTADRLLFEKWARGRDARAFKSLAGKYAGMVYATCARVLGNGSDAEDAAQECFIALAGMKTGPRGPMGAWLHQVATKQALQRLRSDRRRKKREERFAQSRPSHTEIQWNDLAEYVDEAIAELPALLREAIVAHFLEDQTLTAIAQREEVTHSAISQRVQRGVEGIRVSLRRRGVAVGRAALAAMLTSNTAKAGTVPVKVSAGIGRLALSGATVATGRLALMWLTAPRLLAGGAAMLVLAAALWGLRGQAPPETVLASTDGETPVVAADTEPASVTPVHEASTATMVGVRGASGTVAVRQAASATNATEDMSDPMEIVDAHARHLAKIQRIAVKFQSVRKGEADYYMPELAHLTGKTEWHMEGEFVTDGDRCLRGGLQWGRLFPAQEQYMPKKQASYGFELWDGERHFDFLGVGPDEKAPPDDGSTRGMVSHPSSEDVPGMLYQGRNFLLYGREEGLMRGYALGGREMAGARVDEVFRAASSLKLRPFQEPVNGVQCHVVDGEMPYGSFTAWFDPEHDHNLVKAALDIRHGLNTPQSLQVTSTKRTRQTVVHTVQRFQEVDGLWVPAEAVTEISADYEDGSRAGSTTRYTRTQIVLNPDFDAYQAAALARVPNGTRWRGSRRDENKLTEEGTLTEEGNYLWQEGELVPDG